MGYRLYREVLDRAPASLSSGDRLVFAVIADYCNDTTREGQPGMADVTRRAGLSSSGVGKALARLAAKGIEIRVPIGRDTRGRLVFAFEGEATRYRIPELPPRVVTRPGDHSRGSVVAAPGDHSAPEWSPARPPVVARPGVSGRPPGRPKALSPSKSTQQQRETAEEQIQVRTGATADEAAIAAERIRRDRPDIRNLAAVLPRFRDDELVGVLRGIREERGRQDVAAFLADAKTQPVCDPEHQVPGGRLIRPDTGKRVCRMCQQADDRSAA